MNNQAKNIGLLLLLAAAWVFTHSSITATHTETSTQETANVR